MNFSGLVLDFYDNPSSIKEIFPTEEEIPERVKTASALAPEERDALPDHVFALVMRNGEGRLRKYACIDAGNTELAVRFFLKNAHKLPVEAQKVAAVNLCTACGWYGLEPPESLEKVALGLGTALLAAAAPLQAAETKGQIQSNLAAQNRIIRPAGTIVTPEQRRLAKYAEASGTHAMPYQGATKPPVKKAVIPKTAEVGHLVDGHKKSEQPEQLEETQVVSGEQVQKLPQGKDLQPYVDVTKKEPPPKEEKTAQLFAIGRSYPLGDYGQVKTAAVYYEENKREFSCHERREYCTNLVKRAAALGIPVSEEIRTYGSPSRAPMSQVKVALDMRRPYVDERMNRMLDELQKVAGIIDPDVFCASLGVLDRQAQIDWMYDRNILDPYLSTFGIDKTAENESWTQGADYITRRQIENYAITAFTALAGDYGEDFAKEFQKDPWGIFQSLPLDQKRRMARAAGDNAPSGKQNVA